MKRNRDILSFFRDREVKAKNISSSSSPAKEAREVEETQESRGETQASGNQLTSSQTENIDAVINVVVAVNDQSQPQPRSAGASNTLSSSEENIYDVELLPHDPGKRTPITSYDVNDQDAVRRGYIMKGPCQPYTHDFPVREIFGKRRHFSLNWFDKYHWIEYSVEKDAAFCFVCYLFKEKTVGGDSFVKGGWRNWNKYDALDKHVGGIRSVHNQAQEKFNFFVKPKTSVAHVIVKRTKEDKRLYKTRFSYSLRCLRFILHQGLAFHGHDASEQSSNKGNFLELLKWFAESNEEVNKVVLKNAPRNCILTSHPIQKEIINCCAKETTRQIIEDIGDNHFAIIADESSDVSQKEQLALCLRYVDKLGRVCERFLGVVHVADTTSLSLKGAIESLLIDHSLSLTQVRGQGYDGASNLKGEIEGLKTLIMNESPSAYYIHCFAHQLQLVLVAVAKGNADCVWFFDQLSNLLNIIGVSCKRHEMLRNTRAQEVLEALDSGEIESGRGLNQEMGLARPGDTRWGSHYKTVLHIISLYSTIRKVLIKIGKDPSLKNEWGKVHTMVAAFESFDFIFMANLMLVILGYTDDLCQSLQKRDQDIINAMTLVNLAKNRLQHMRSYGWEDFLQEKVTSFCMKHRIKVPEPNKKYMPFGRSKRFFPKQTNDDHFRREVYLCIIDSVLQELDNRFDKVSMELLVCMFALNPRNSFEAFDKKKVLNLANFYPNEFSSTDLMRLPFQLDTFIDDMRSDDRFKDLNNLGDLSIKLVETKKHEVYKLVYLLLKLVLLLPVATASVERVFSAMSLVKNQLRNSMGDQFLNDCLVTFIEREIFLKVNEDDLMKRFQDCTGTQSEEAGKAEACAGCPNQQIYATAPKGPDPDLVAIVERMATVKHKILVLSGKGGVGKSTFSAQLSFALAEMDHQVGLLDIDICGPSIPKMLGLEGQDIHQSNVGWSPVYVEANLGVMSIGFMLPNPDDAVIWRGPRKNGLIKQFLKDVDWGEIDYLVVDAPPGTSDEHISIVQYLQATGIDGAIIVTTPQQVSLIDVRKEINFCKKVGVPVLGVVENMSGLRQALSDFRFVKPGDAGEIDATEWALNYIKEKAPELLSVVAFSEVFDSSKGGAEKMCHEMGVPFLGKVPMDPQLCKAAEEGRSCFVDQKCSASAPALKSIVKMLIKTE